MNYKLSGNNFNQVCVVHGVNGISRCIIGCGGNGGYHAGNEPKVLIKGVKNMSKLGNINPSENGQSGNVYSTDDVARTQCANGGGTGAKTGLYEEEYRIRKLTPCECWKLMAFTPDQFKKAQDAGISNTQLYKQAGNSIVVDVLFYIYKNLYESMPYLFDDLKLCSLFSGIGAPEAALDKLYKEIINGQM